MFIGIAQKKSKATAKFVQPEIKAMVKNDIGVNRLSLAGHSQRILSCRPQLLGFPSAATRL
jgi:hypothetical protein